MTICRIEEVLKTGQKGVKPAYPCYLKVQKDCCIGSWGQFQGTVVPRMITYSDESVLFQKWSCISQISCLE